MRKELPSFNSFCNLALKHALHPWGKDVHSDFTEFSLGNAKSYMLHCMLQGPEEDHTCGANGIFLSTKYCVIVRPFVKSQSLRTQNMQFSAT